LSAAFEVDFDLDLVVSGLYSGHELLSDAKVHVKSGGQEVCVQQGLLSLFSVFVAKIESERRVVTRAGDLDGQFGLTVLAEEGIEGFQQE
jgi:hypothetical protein